jgi:hypothetical protein
MKTIDQFNEVLEELQEEDGALTEEQFQCLVTEMLIPALCSEFAEHYSEMDNAYDYDPNDPNALDDIFETWAQFEGLPEELEDAVANEINVATVLDEEDNVPARSPIETIYNQPGDKDSDDVDDNDVVFKQWEKLSDDERKRRVKQFLKKISAAHSDAREGKPWFKNLDVGKDPYANDFGVTKTFDRDKNRFDHATDEAIQFANLFHQEHEDPRDHPLHQTALTHGFEYSHSVGVNQRDGSILNHHVWQHPTGHRITSSVNDTKWNSKVSASSAHVHTGIGTKALDKHLALKAKRYKIQNNEAVAHTNILENLLSGHDKAQRYANWMNKNLPTAFGVVGGTYDVQSPKTDLLEAYKMRKEHEKRFPKKGKSKNRWKLYEVRTKGMQK